VPDLSGGAALGALVEAARRGEIEPGSRVVLVVTGARPEANTSDGVRTTTIAPDPAQVLSALGLRS
jgi:hypothetical protein